MGTETGVVVKYEECINSPPNSRNTFFTLSIPCIIFQFPKLFETVEFCKSQGSELKGKWADSRMHILAHRLSYRAWP